MNRPTLSRRFEAPYRPLAGVLLVACCGVFALLAAPGVSSAASPEEAIAFANQQRAAYGIPLWHEAILYLLRRPGIRDGLRTETETRHR
jgi:hypothetical protein